MGCESIAGYPLYLVGLPPEPICIPGWRGALSEFGVLIETLLIPYLPEIVITTNKINVVGNV